MKNEIEGQTRLSRLKTLISTLESCGVTDDDDDDIDDSAPTPTRLKRELLSSLLSGEITPEDFKAQVKENDLSTIFETQREFWQSQMEFYGTDATVFFEGKEFTFQEVFDQFEVFKAHIVDYPNKNFSRSKNFHFPNDPNAIINKISDASLSDEERKHIYEAHNERWGITNGEV